MKLVSLTLCLVFLLVGNSSVSYSSCLVPEVVEGYERAKAVFVGKVIEITPPRSTNQDAPFEDRASLPKDAKPRPKIMRDSVVDRNNGTEDLRALDGLFVLKGR